MVTRMKIAAYAAGMIASLMGATALAQDFTPAIVFDMGGKFDKSFNEAAYTGAERFKKETGIAYREFEITNENQREQALGNLAKRGVAVIVSVGFAQQAAVEKIAPQYPNVKFVIIDSVVNAPNAQSIIFKEEEGSFLVGALAALASKTGKVGFVGGMDIPLIRAFGCGYAQGAKYINPKADYIANMTGTTPSAWRDPAKGSELAISQFDRGVDVVFAAAGGTGIGVMQAAKDKGKLAVGVDSNQNHVQPGTVLTSMLKRVDNAVYNTFSDAKKGTWKAGTISLGLKEDGVDWALDDNNRKLVTADMEKKIKEIRADIIGGKIKVVDYRANNNSCPVS
ncbi:MAG: BMP family lipoprotein [Elstera sp.]